MATTSILLVEDDVTDQLAYTRALSQENYPFTSVIASSLTEARAAMAQVRFDIIVCDYLLGNDTAFDLLSIAGDTPVVVVTSFGDEDVAVRAMKAGAYDYLIKDWERRYLKMLPVVVENTLKRKEAEQQARLIAAERVRIEAVHELVRNASHDLRTPLTILVSSTDLIQLHASKLRKLPVNDPDSIEIAREIAAKIQNRCEVMSSQQRRLDSLFKSMLTMVELDMIQNIERSEYDIVTLTSHIVDGFQPRAKGRKVLLTFTAPERAVNIRIGTHEYALMLDNLLRNALENTPDGGLVSIAIASTRTAVTVSVEDTGAGIPASALPHIFDRFYRIDAARGVENGGAGLGLAIVKRVVDLHSGTIDVQSTVGKGTVFTILFPTKAALPQ